MSDAALLFQRVKKRSQMGIILVRAFLNEISDFGTDIVRLDIAGKTGKLILDQRLSGLPLEDMTDWRVLCCVVVCSCYCM